MRGLLLRPCALGSTLVTGTPPLVLGAARIATGGYELSLVPLQIFGFALLLLFDLALFTLPAPGLLETLGVPDLDEGEGCSAGSGLFVPDRGSAGLIRYNDLGTRTYPLQR